MTYLPGASFAPFFFPNGKRIIFSSNHLAPRGPEFDLFAVDIDGSHLEQITFAGGFDGFPVFSPDGKTLSMSSNRKDVIEKDGTSVYRVNGMPAGPTDTNVFLVDWVDDVRDPTASTPPPRPTMEQTHDADDFAAIVNYLADDARDGRGVGTKGLDQALATLEQQLKVWGLEPGNAGSFRQEFEVTTKVERGAKTAMELDGKPLAAADFTPLASSASSLVKGAIEPVGWGIVDVDAKLDDYKGKNVKGKIALVHRFVPPDAKLEAPAAGRLGDLRYKAFIARGKGATGLIVIDDGDLKQDEAPLPSLAAAESESGIPIVVITRKAGAALGLRKGGGHRAILAVALEPVRAKTTNLVAVVRAGAAQKQPGVVVLGAHLDHLGMGGPSALDKEPGIHNGADDNASGVAGLMQAAQALVKKRAELARDVYIVAFSAEEMGALGSEYYVKHAPTKEPIVAMLNMDMIGRMRNNIVHVNGGGSATEWKDLVEAACKAAKVSCTIGGSGYGPSDHMPFYIAGSPVLFFFTGSHSDYHTATDDADKINAIGGARIAAIATDVAFATANRKEALTYVKAPPEAMGSGDVRRRGASLGTIPSYSEEPNLPPGMVLSDVAPDGPAAKAGLKGGDRIVALGTAEIRSVSDLMFVLESAKPGTEVKVTFVRAGKTQTVTATYGVPRSRR
ncbi:MAG: M20/M25/M40 family metallo-hydrolase [Deltaproteobacteria bacterium]|nr:M20/M25/M40 family metallo-hydrolase [Deltaproteobacteria bacterium]